MRKITVTFMLLAIAFVKMNAQVEYHHGFGLGAHAFIAKDQNTSESVSGYTFAYQARLNLANLGSKGSLSLLTNPSFGFSGNSRTGGNFLYDLPLFAAANFGYFANNDTDSGFGVYGGMGYQFWGFGATELGSASGNNPAAILGIRFNISDRPIDISGSYGFNKLADIIVLRLTYCLGGSDMRNDMGGKIRKRRRG
jgi:hypothetical protein